MRGSGGGGGSSTPTPLHTHQTSHHMLCLSPAGLANCYNWKAGANSTCPATCKLSKSPSGPVSIDLKGCAACTDGERNLPLTCFRCKPGFAHLYYAVDLHVSARGSCRVRRERGTASPACLPPAAGAGAGAD